MKGSRYCDLGGCACTMNSASTCVDNARSGSRSSDNAASIFGFSAGSAETARLVSDYLQSVLARIRH